MAASFWRIGFGVEEFFRFLAGVVALYAPFAAMLYLLLKGVQDRLARGTLSCIGSYALTSLVYFGCAWLGAGWLLYLLQVAAVIWGVIGVARTRERFRLREFPGRLARLDGLLLLLIALSLLVTSPCKVLFVANPATGQQEYRLFPDHLYHAGLSYELSRHVPPRQASIRGGTPERAYHLFPHLTTMLLGRYTGQGDLLRAHVVYHLTVIEVLMCLALCGIARIITGVRWAGYISIALMYPLAVAWPKLIDNGYPSFYFTLFPHASSGLEPVELLATQMYSGLAVMYGVLLALLLISDHLADDSTDPALLLITAMLVAALERFRIHIFLVLFPAFLLVMIYCWRRRRERWYLAAGGTALLVAVALFWEMKSPVYSQDSATVKLAFNWFTASMPFFNSWPLAAALKGFFPQGTFTGRLLWELISVPMFVLLNLIGIPLIAMTVAFLRTDEARGRFKLFSFTLCWAAVMSWLMGLFLSLDYDAWSLGGQMLLHIRWYLFPLEGAVLSLIFLRLRPSFTWPGEVWAKAGGVMVVLVMVVVGWRFFVHEPDGPASLRDYRVLVPATKAKFSPDEWQALLYLRQNASPDAVIMSNEYCSAYFFPFSGIAGRAAFLEFGGNILDLFAMKLNPEDNRVAFINTLWATTEPAVFCNTLSKTKATLIVEYAKAPLKVHPAACLRRWWQGPAGQVTIWQVSQR
jgi:hypothetical protein